MGASIKSLTTAGYSGILVDIECSLSNNLPIIIIVGYANKAVNEAKERIRGAFMSSRLELPRKRITINLAPADLPKGDSGFDLGVAVSILLASGQVSPDRISDSAFIGELGLEGHTRAVRGIIGKVLTGRDKGIKNFYLPLANIKQAQLVPGVRLYPVLSLQDIYAHLTGTTPLKSIETGLGIEEVAPSSSVRNSVQMSEIVGQEQAKRALEIAAAGGHNVLFSGPPGTGKSMLAKALPTILPPLSREEMLEVTHLHSLAGHEVAQVKRERPLRAPHHSASFAAVIGGSTSLRPGEISLAHRGVLFFDELPEFNRSTLEALRQPLEDRFISVARAKDTIEYPANFILVATANPCPCGYYDSLVRDCNCEPGQISRYQRRLSGPILDRIDLYTDVHSVEHKKLLLQTENPKEDEAMRTRIARARHVQNERYGTASKLNSDMTNADIRRYAPLNKAAKATLNSAARNVQLSARAYMRCVKVARTIADLEQTATITQAHIAEAIRYRHQPRLTSEGSSVKMLGTSNQRKE